MRRSPVRLAVLLACVLTALALPSFGSAATDSQVRDVPSLDPVRTDALWRKLTSRRIEFRPLEAQQCRPLRAVFYAPGDWLRLATTLAAKASPCGQYYISVPPVVADKTRQRPGQAERIRALGPAFHAMAEIHLTIANDLEKLPVPTYLTAEQQEAFVTQNGSRVAAQRTRARIELEVAQGVEENIAVSSDIHAQIRAFEQALGDT